MSGGSVFKVIKVELLFKKKKDDVRVSFEDTNVAKVGCEPSCSTAVS